MDFLPNGKLFKVGTYSVEFNDILHINLPCTDIFQSAGLITHIYKRHPHCVAYAAKISEIIRNPDYIGINPNEPNSIELVKIFDKNILLAIKLDIDENYLYVASLFDINQKKIERRLNTGRIKRFHHGGT